ncbi:hypothetical protein PR202_ga13355 [Eleusine coracana subsp. coracana]|uniref:Uncharacterized protein n=1 Tax=Eleusine coracana subsp. coracana TaxID=191504 RepID=A0AAV5CE28_ELECO|nr:hypothetical protein QOZ80_3AG0217410 [Eleusine coracana subsp. coracana]GJM96513.1 hypothetical protein PR202_ga13355 [Eleusine coracana subsp. coracana]
MPSMKLSITFILLLSGLVVFGEIGGGTAARAAKCTVQCIQGGYITCDNYGKMEACVCQCAPKKGKNCVLHLHTGSTYNCTAEAY